ncbi:unnamed protein product [Parascedosporium putredinis]|uniref:UBX domain-containing protein n=1 Tax=Parascedosporium putredinis TaxID=1442378 RepID=A0A9P1MCW0_9PEZI|nr:unnamed protein product [Parascedosporium putredinis]CAI8001394.1 unnamed protein product [Parascedosporium putredinis]
MASDVTERAALSPEQQDALDQYMGVTAQDEQAAIALLGRSEWNIQIAIAKYFDGEGPDPLAEALAAQQAPASSAAAAAREPAPDAAPRIVPQRDRIQRPHFLLTLLFTPFALGYRVASVGIRLALYILSFLPRPIRPTFLTSAMASGFRSTSGRRMLLPADTASRFKREFEEEYGPNELPWFEGGFAQAQDLAKKDLKFLLFVLVSPEHDETEAFTRRPCFRRKLTKSRPRFGLRALLAVDRERARERREAAARAAEEEKRAAQAADDAARTAALREQWRRWRASRVRPEPEAGTKGSVRVALKFSDSAEAYDDAEEPEGYTHEYTFALASLMPRKVYGAGDPGTLREVIGASSNLIMEDL